MAEVVTDIEPLITGPPLAELSQNPIVSIRERRWLKNTRRQTERVTVTERVRTATPAHHARIDDMCWDIEEWRDDTVTYNEEQTQQEYVDYTFECQWQDYLDWFNSNPGVKLTVPPDARLGPDGVLAIPRVHVETEIEQPFLQPGQAREGTRGWGRIDGTETKDGQRVVVEGTPYLVETAHRPCKDQPPPPRDNAVALTGSVLVYVVDMESDELVRGGTITAVAPGVSAHDQPVNPPPVTRPGVGKRSYGFSFWLSTGDSITITHQPPPGYVVDHNSADQSPPGRLTVVVTDTTKVLTFYDRKVRTRQAVPGAAPSTPPPVTPPPETPPPEKPPEQPPDKPLEKRKEHAGRRLPAWAWAVAALAVVVIVAVIVALVSAGGGGGGSGGGSAAKGSGSNAPSSGSSSNTSTPLTVDDARAVIADPNTAQALGLTLARGPDVLPTAADVWPNTPTMQQAFADYRGGVAGQFTAPGFDPTGASTLSPSMVSRLNVQVWRFGSPSAGNAADTSYLDYLTGTVAPSAGGTTTRATVAFGDQARQVVITGKGPVLDYLVFTKGPDVVSLSALSAPGVADGAALANVATRLLDVPDQASTLAHRIDQTVDTAPK